MLYQNLRFLQDVFLNTQKIFSWSLSPDMQLLYTNCREQDFFFDLFSVSQCRDALEQHFSFREDPIIVADAAGFVWIAALQNIVKTEQSPIIHLLGPVFTSSVTDQYISKHIKKLALFDDAISRIWHAVKEIPSISYDMASSFASMLNSCVNQNNVLPFEIGVWRETGEAGSEVTWGVNEWHGDWAEEQLFMKSISEGRVVDLNKITTGTLGNIGGGDPFRQAKNMIIVFAVLCSRAAIKGGVSVEGSLGLSDYYIRSAEAAATISAVEAVGTEMYHAYITRVQEARKNSRSSPLVQACAEYIQTHIFERIRLEDIAVSIGYTDHYVSHRFKEETGISLFRYINEQKIEMAKRLFHKTTVPITEVSSRLAYTSPSYFGSIFKKITGMTPGEYQTKLSHLSDDESVEDL